MTPAEGHLRSCGEPPALLRRAACAPAEGHLRRSAGIRFRKSGTREAGIENPKLITSEKQSQTCVLLWARQGAYRVLTRSKRLNKIYGRLSATGLVPLSRGEDGRAALRCCLGRVAHLAAKRTRTSKSFSAARCLSFGRPVTAAPRRCGEGVGQWSCSTLPNPIRKG